MLRSARLIIEDALRENGKHGLITDVKEIEDVHTFYGYKLIPQVGDTTTGWEIIASLPLEVQKNSEVVFHKFQEMFIEQWKDHSFVETLSTLYRWNGEAWEVVE